jgi:hypothetical protein
MSDDQQAGNPAPELYLSGMATHVTVAAQMLDELVIGVLSGRPKDQVEYACALAKAQARFLRSLVADAIQSGYVNPEQREALHKSGRLDRDLGAVIADGTEAVRILDAHNAGTLRISLELHHVKPGES